jgi:hypothetical protein
MTTSSRHGATTTRLVLVLVLVLATLMVGATGCGSDGDTADEPTEEIDEGDPDQFENNLEDEADQKEDELDDKEEQFDELDPELSDRRDEHAEALLPHAPSSSLMVSWSEHDADGGGLLRGAAEGRESTTSGRGCGCGWCGLRRSIRRFWIAGPPLVHQCDCRVDVRL